METHGKSLSKNFPQIFYSKKCWELFICYYDTALYEERKKRKESLKTLELELLIKKKEIKKETRKKSPKLIIQSHTVLRALCQFEVYFNSYEWIFLFFSLC